MTSRTSGKQIGLALLVSALSLAVIPSATANEILPKTISAETPIGWQKVALDEMIQTKITRALAQSLPEKYFAVTVSTALAEETEPAKEGRGKAKAADSDSGAPQLGKLSLDMNLLMATMQGKGAEARQAPNVFKSIKSVAVNVILDDRVPEAKHGVVRTLVGGIVSSIAPPEATRINVASAPLYTPPEELQPPKAEEDKDEKAAKAAEAQEQKKPEEEPWSLQRWVSELKYTAGLLFAAAIAGFIALMIAGGNRKLEARRISLLEAKNMREESAEQRNLAATSQTIVSGASVSPMDEQKAVSLMGKFEGGLDRYRRVLKQAPDRAAQLIRQWLKNPRHGAAEALSVLPQALALEELNALFDRLGADERKEWRQFLNLPVDAASARIADSFIASQVVDNFLVPVPKLDENVRKELNELSLADCLDLAKDNPEDGAILANVLSSSMVARVFTLLPADLASQVTLASVRMSEDQIAARAPALMRSVSTLKSRKKNVRFLDNAAELLRDVGPERENAIFSALADSGEFRLLETAARQFYPAELVLRLPPSSLKTALDSLTLEKRSEIIYSRQGAERSALLQAFGTEGSRLREMIDLELQQIDKDDLKRKRIERNRNLLWKEFSDVCRGLIRKDENAREFAEMALNAWLFDRSSGAVGAREDTRAA